MVKWPQIGACPRYGSEVLKARHAGGGPGRPFVLDLPEASSLRRSDPRYRLIRSGGWRIAVDPKGRARKLGPREHRAKGEAIHARHRCEP